MPLTIPLLNFDPLRYYTGHFYTLMVKKKLHTNFHCSRYLLFHLSTCPKLFVHTHKLQPVMDSFPGVVEFSYLDRNLCPLPAHRGARQRQLLRIDRLPVEIRRKVDQVLVLKLITIKGCISHELYMGCGQSLQKHWPFFIEGIPVKTEHD